MDKEITIKISRKEAHVLICALKSSPIYPRSLEPNLTQKDFELYCKIKEQIDSQEE